MRNQKGQGVVESLLAMPVLFIFVGGLGYLIYLALNYQVASYHLHEALLCSQSRSVSVCQKDASRGIAKLLIFQEKFELRISKGQKVHRGSVRLKLKPELNLKLDVPTEF